MVLTLLLAFLAQRPSTARTFQFCCLKFGESCPTTVTTAIMVWRGRKTYTFDCAMKRFTCPVRQPRRVWTLRPFLAPQVGLPEPIRKANHKFGLAERPPPL